MDWVKEVIDTYFSRIKSPVIGSVVTVFIAINWQPLFYVIFSGEAAPDKFDFWNENTNWITKWALPIGIGFAIAFLVPWISYLGSFASYLPTTLLNNLKEKSNHEKQLDRLNLSIERTEAETTLEDKRLRIAKTIEERDKVVTNIATPEIKQELLDKAITHPIKSVSKPKKLPPRDDAVLESFRNQIRSLQQIIDGSSNTHVTRENQKKLHEFLLKRTKYIEETSE